MDRTPAPSPAARPRPEAPPLPAAPPRYTPLQDVQGLVVSSIMAALGLTLPRTAGLVTGGTAGLAMVVAYAAGWSFPAVFFVINLPFYAFAWTARGAVFAVKSFASVTLVSLMAGALPAVLEIARLHPAAAALLFGVVTGVGLLGLFRHGSSLGGVSILAVILQDRGRVRAGWFQLGVDAAIFAAALAVLPLPLWLWSLAGAAVLNFVIAMNHRREWYVVG